MVPPAALPSPEPEWTLVELSNRDQEETDNQEEE